MANLRDIKKRINNVAVIEKMTQSMKAISTSRLSGAKARKYANKSYIETSKYAINTLLDLQKKQNLEVDGLISKIMTRQEDSKYKKTLFIIIASDRGLCGSYNHNIFKRCTLEILQNGVQKSLLAAIGDKSKQFTNKLYKDISLGLYFSSDSRKDISSDIIKMTDYITSMVVEDKIDRIQFIYTKSISIISQEVVLETIFPISNQDKDIQVDNLVEEDNKNIVTDNKNFCDIAEELLRQYISITLYEKITDSSVSEHASRLNAMAAAYDNSKELKRVLNLEYNRTRQGLITKELIEIISGAEAL